jgi:hypothetical protein
MRKPTLYQHRGSWYARFWNYEAEKYEARSLKIPVEATSRREAKKAALQMAKKLDEVSGRFIFKNGKEEGLEKRRRHKMQAERKRAERRKYYAENHEKMLEYAKKWRKAHQEETRQYRIEYYQTHKNQISKRFYSRYDNDIGLQISMNLRSRLVKAVLNGRGIKSAKTMALIGCTAAELMAHLEAQFKPGMTWENHGEWHIDHIKPCASFDLVDPEQQKACFHYTNLQPLWKNENLQKGAKYGGIDYRGKRVVT